MNKALQCVLIASILSRQKDGEKDKRANRIGLWTRKKRRNATLHGDVRESNSNKLPKIHSALASLPTALLISSFQIVETNVDFDGSKVESSK